MFEELKKERAENSIKIDSLHKQRDELIKQMNVLYERNKEIDTMFDEEFLKDHFKSKDIAKFSNEEWEWLLSHKFTEPKYAFQQKLFRQYGLLNSGYYHETQQEAFIVSESCISLKDKFLYFFEVAFKHIKPVTITDTRHGEETGIRLDVYLKENWTSTAYIQADKTVHFYEDSWRSVKNFNSLAEFVEWYISEKTKKEDEDED